MRGASSDGARTLRRVAVLLVVALFGVVGALIAKRRQDGFTAGDAASTTDADSTSRHVGTPRTRPRVEPPPPAPTRPRALHVAVTGLDGKPIVGAKVELFRGPASEEWTDNEADDFRPSVVAPQPVASATSDAAGDALLDVPAGRWFVAASAPGYGRHAAIAPAAGADSLVLAPSVRFGGTITSADGSPAEGVAVVLAPTWTSSKWPSDAACLRTTTDRDGTYVFHVEPGEYRVWYGPQADLLLQADQVRIPALDRYDVAMSAGAVIEGTIGDVDSGEPLADAEVVAVQYAVNYGTSLPLAVAAGRSDKSGAFRMRTWSSPASFDGIVIDDQRLAPNPETGTGRSPGGRMFDGDRVALDVRVRRAASVAGVVSGPDGPIPGFSVFARPDKGPELTGRDRAYYAATTDADGRYRIAGLPRGEVELSVFRPTQNSEVVHEAKLELTDGAELVHDAMLDVVRTRIEGRVVESGDPDDVPLADVEVSQEEGTLRCATRTDADGRFAIDVQLFGGAVELTLRRADFLTSVQIVKPGEAEPLTLTLSSKPYVAVGTVTDATGTRVPGARVQMVSGQVAQGAFILLWPGNAETVTADDGTFRIPVTSVECDTVVAFRPQDGAFSGFSNGLGPEPIDIRLEPQRRVSGRIVAAGGDVPIADALIHQLTSSWASDDDVIVGRTRADGRFEIDYQPGEKNALRVTAAGCIDERVADKEIGDDLRVEMTPSLVLAGVVRNEDGSPAVGATVSATPVDAATRDASKTATTDASGRFTIRDVAPGRWNVLVSRDDPTIVPARVVAAAGDRGLSLVAHPGRMLLVAVVDGDGAPIKGAMVTSQADAQSSDDDATDGAGRAHLAVPLDAPLVVHVACDGYEPFEKEDVRPGDEPLRVVLVRTKPR